MPKQSLNPDLASSSAVIEAGVYRVGSGTKFQNLQVTDKVQCHLVLPCTPCDSNGEPLRGGSEVDIQFSAGDSAVKRGIHPGRAQTPEDDPIDMGDGLDMEGNTLYKSDESNTLHKTCGMVVFMDSLVKHGYPKTVL